MSDATQIIGVVSAVIIVCGFLLCFVRTHKGFLHHVDKRNEHALLRQDQRDEATERREQRTHDRDIARSKRAMQMAEHEREMAHRTSAHTAPAHTGSYDTIHREDKAAERHNELIDLNTHHGARDEKHAPTAPHNSYVSGHSSWHPVPGVHHSFHIPSPHPTIQAGSIHSSHASVTHGGSNVLPHGWEQHPNYTHVVGHSRYSGPR